MENSKTFDAQLVLNSIYNGIIAIDGEGMITYFNKTAERIFNIPAHDASGKYILDVLPNTGGKLLECLTAGKPFYGEKLKGEKVTLVCNINPIVNNRKITGAASVFQDISEIERISKELDLFKDIKTWLDTIIDTSYDGLWICDHEGKVVRINRASERINGLRAEDVVGMNMGDRVTVGLLDRSVTLEVLKKKTCVTMIQKTAGKKLLVTGNPIFDDRGNITYVVTNERDIMELDNLRSKLQEVEDLAKGYSSKVSELELRGVDLSNIIFRSAEMQRIVEMALRVAQVDSTVLLLGESGVGKGMIAKLIHKQSDRNSRVFFRVDLASIPDSLIESELFGYEKGAFTGANPEGRSGFLELANKGTLFLDEIGEIPLTSQSKLLRFLDDHEIIRVGGKEPKEIDVRIIAATNKNIEERIASKKFREDLYYRLNVIPIQIPPLRERRDDIPPLLFYFLKKFNLSYQKTKILLPQTVEALCGYDFPGNIRELTNLIERLVVTTESDRIELKDLPPSITGSIAKPGIYPPISQGISLKEALEKYEEALIGKAMRRYGSQRKVARILKVDQATVSRKIKKYSGYRLDALSHM